MKYRNLMLALASCFLVASCSKEEIETLPKNEGDVVFTASMRTVARATETSFEEGDKIGVYAVSAQENTASQLLPKGNYADNVCYTYSGGKFVNQQGIVRPTDGGLRYYAIYPYMTSCGANFRFSVKTNQASSGQYTASDLCTAVSDVTMDKEVDLVFSHRLSHVIINLEGEALGTGTAAVKLNNVNIGCDVDLNANTFTAYESRSTVVCADNGTNSYKAIIAPQTIKEGTVLLTITLNGKDYVFKTTSDLRFASGKQQIFNLTIEKDEIVSFTGEILPWGEEDEKKVGIYCLEDLVAFRDARNAGEDVSRWKNEDGEINIYADIDLGEMEWIPIEEIESDETLNGNGHTITLMKEDMSSYEKWGFIGTNQGTIKNLNIDAFLFIDEDVKEGVGMSVQEIGIFCIKNKGLIKDSNFSLLGDCNLGNEDFGGIACNNYGTIERCTAEGTMEVELTSGGICSFNAGMVMTCVNRLNQKSTTGGDCVGGITGYNSGKAEIYDCVNEADITFIGGWGVGGIVGRMFSGKLEGCINKGNIIGYEENSRYSCHAVGGIIGNALNEGGGSSQGICSILKCTNQGNVYGKAEVTGGIVGIISNSKSVVEDCIYEGDVNGESGSESNAIGKDQR